jgi:type III secretory pathway component EscV
METVRFADILFILLACLVTFGILMLTNRKRTDRKEDTSKEKVSSEEQEMNAKSQSDGNNN